MRQVVRAILPLGDGIVLDTFCGSGSTLAAAEAVGYASVGVEASREWVGLAKAAIPKLAALDAPGFPGVVENGRQAAPRPALVEAGLG